MPDCVEAGRVREGRKGMPSTVEPAWKPGSRNPECISARASSSLNGAEKGNEWIGVAGVARPTISTFKISRTKHQCEKLLGNYKSKLTKREAVSTPQTLSYMRHSKPGAWDSG